MVADQAEPVAVPGPQPVMQDADGLRGHIEHVSGVWCLVLMPVHRAAGCTLHPVELKQGGSARPVVGRPTDLSRTHG